MAKKKNKITANMICETGIRVIFFFAWPALFSTAWGGIKMIVEEVKDLAAIELNSFTLTLIILLLFTIVFGRFFCGYACAFGSLGDFIYSVSSWIRKKMKKKPFRVFGKWGDKLLCLKYLLALGILAAVIAGYNNQVSLNSPFTAFSQLYARTRPKSSIALSLFLLIIIGMTLEPRFFCRFLCPMGAVFSLMPILPFSIFKRDRDQCISGCSACQRICPANLELPSTREGDNLKSGQCFSCGKCAGVCPRQNAGDSIPKKFRLPMLLLKAALLFGMIYYIY